MKEAEQIPYFDRVEISDPRFATDGLRHMTMYSKSLQGRADLSLFVPQGVGSGAQVPMVFLLHGVYGSHWSWFLQCGAHHTARRLIAQKKIRPMLLVTPSDGLDGDGTAYLPAANRDNESWICRDLISCLEEQFCAGGQRAEICLAGLSMGGYGALRLGAKYARTFRAISAHSAITGLEDMRGFVRDMSAWETLPLEETDPFRWIARNRAELPPLRFDCGEQDGLFTANVALHERLKVEKIPHEFVAYAGGHECSYWETHVADTLLFFENILRAGDQT